VRAGRAFSALWDNQAEHEDLELGFDVLGVLHVVVQRLLNIVEVFHTEWRSAHRKGGGRRF
jgi:hypothetical protein